LVAIAWSFRDFNSWPDAFVLLPMAAVGVGGIARGLTQRLPAAAAVTLCVASAVAGVAIAWTYSTTRDNDRLELQRTAVSVMLERVPSDPSIQSIGAPEPLVLSRSTNPTRHQTFTRGLAPYVNDTWPGGLRGFARWVGRQEPMIISMDNFRTPWWLRRTLEREYRKAGRAPGWIWYVHRSLGPVDLRLGSAGP
jgi:hypothetical protein